MPIPQHKDDTLTGVPSIKPQTSPEREAYEQYRLELVKMTGQDVSPLLVLTWMQIKAFRQMVAQHEPHPRVNTVTKQPELTTPAAPKMTWKPNP